jgi:hypothetical protein
MVDLPEPTGPVTATSGDDAADTATPADGSESVGLSFVDLLYAVPVGVLATRLSDVSLDRVTASGWADTAVALTAITLGWIGHHSNRNRVPECARRRDRDSPFTTARFLQFVVEILIIGAYFGLAGNVLRAPLSDVDRAGLIFVTFVLYLIWDGFDIHIAHHCTKGAVWHRRAKRGARVTAVFAGVFAVVWLVVPAVIDLSRPHSTVAFDVALILLLYAYRAVQEIVGREGRIKAPGSC